MSGGGSKARRKRREVLYEMQAGLCAHCGKPMPHPHEEAHRLTRPTLEHVKPKSEGGTDAWVNLLVVHAKCNHRRDTHPLWRRARRVHRDIKAQLMAPEPLAKA